jgi:hypothetical protein
MARGSERNHDDTAQDEPTIGNGPRIKINQRSLDTLDLLFTFDGDVPRVKLSP